VYLACPYTSEVAGQLEERMEMFYRTVAHLQKSGVFVVSPLFMHQVLKYDPALGHDWNFWKGYAEELIGRSDEMRVLCLNGWDRSKGIRGEIEIAKSMGKSVSFIPAESVI
jgi:hypothetical protein